MTESVIFATPTRGSVADEYKSSMLATMMLLLKESILFGFVGTEGDLYPGLFRDKMSTAFLRKCEDADNYFCIDDDVGWPPHKVVEFLRRPQEIVVGVPRLKQEKVKYPVDLATDSSGDLIEKDGLLKARSCAPFGFCRIKRATLERMAAEVRTYREVAFSKTYGMELHALFDHGIGDDGFYIGEDVAFVRRAMALGIDVWVDPDIEFTHRGSYAFCGRFADELR